MCSVFRLGLTGGIGSGKSTVAGMLAKLGANVVDADALSRKVTARNGAAIAPIAAVFGKCVLTTDGALDRNKMRTLVYSDPTAKSQLEQIVHPIVAREMDELASDAELAGARCIVFDIPLLIESNRWRETLHKILVVDCTQSTQLTRVMLRNNLRKDEVQKILAAQAPRTLRLRAADSVLFNDGIKIDDLTHRVHKFSSQFGL
jgi:dephospho-CoA kinase